jgi:biotin carboxyl carrier protein
MRYYVDLADKNSATGTQSRQVDVEVLPSGALAVTLDGRKVDVDVVAIGEQLSIRIDGHVVDLTTEGQMPEIGAVIPGHRSYVRVESDRLRAALAAKKSGGGAASGLLKSPMPGRVVKILVEKGQSVKVGQPLIVVEAMKMENELKAKLEGTITELFVVTGATVEANAKLLVIG